MSVDDRQSERGRPDVCWTKPRATKTLRSHGERHAVEGAAGQGGAGRVDSCERRLRVRYSQSALKISPMSRTRLRVAGMCAQVAPREIANKNSKSARFDDPEKKLKHAGKIAGDERSIVRSSCFKILSHAIYAARVRCRSQSFRLKGGWLISLKKVECALGVCRVRMSYPLVGGGGSRFGVAPRAWPPPGGKRGE
jgi:hypothetical protein